MRKVNVKVSIIIPVYNVENYLRQCLDSILNQTFTDFECILIDDGAIDMSGEICDEYSLKDSRFIVIHTSNSGQGGARNKGLDIAKGDYIVFVDSDDFLEESYLQYLAELIDGSDYDFVSCCANFVDEGGNFIKRNDYNFAQKQIVGNDIWEAFFGGNLIEDALWNKIYKRQIWECLRFREGLIYEDSEIIVRILKASKKVLFTREYLYNYRIRDNSTMAYQNSTVENRIFKKKDLDLLQVYTYCVNEMQGTKWENIYRSRILYTCSSNMTQLQKLVETKQIENLNEKQEMIKLLKKYYRENKYVLNKKDAGMTLKTKVAIWLSMRMPVVWRIIQNK